MSFNLLDSMFEQAKEMEVKGQYSQADKVVSEIIGYNNDTGGSTPAKVFNLRGIIRRMLSRYEEALEDYENVLHSNPDNEQKALSFVNIADIQRVAFNNLEEAHLSLDEALTFSGNETLMHAKAVDQRGLVFLAQKNYDCAISSYQRANEICEGLSQKDPENKDIKNRHAQVLHHLGVAYVLKNDSKLIDQAYQTQIEALSEFIKLDDQQGIVNTTATSGNISLIKNDPEKAVEHYEQAWITLENTGYKRAISSLALSLAHVYIQQGKEKEAKPYLERFCQGVLNDEITQHDSNLLKEKFREVFSKTPPVYHNQVKGFEDARKKIGVPMVEVLGIFKS